MQESLQHETEKLVRSWAHHDPAWLATYLVASVEDPRINLQSILTRHYLARIQWGSRFEELMTEEYRFSAAVEWLVKWMKRAPDPEETGAVLYALRKGADNAEGLELPLFLVQTFAGLPRTLHGVEVPNYIEESLLTPGSRIGPVEHILDTFQTLWDEVLDPERLESGTAQAQTQRPSVLEPACGSANDYRFLHSYGLARFFDYSGFDLCAQNVQNARSLFPHIRFQPGNVFEIGASDKSYDFCVVHDLFEHLSLEGMETAVREICRVTRRGLCLGFFQMEEIQEHRVRPVDDYHWNLLSMKRMRELFAYYGFTGQVLHVGTFLKLQVGAEETHNPNAYTFQLYAR